MKPPLTPVPCARRTEPRDGGVLNPATKGRYSLFKATDVERRIKAEQRRLERMAERAAAPVPPVVSFLTPRSHRP
jgi:hypothetical protein